MRHSDLYLECPQGWQGERKVLLLPLWWCWDSTTKYWTVYSSRQWFRMSHNEFFPFSISAGKILFAVEEY